MSPAVPPWVQIVAGLGLLVLAVVSRSQGNHLGPSVGARRFSHVTGRHTSLVFRVVGVLGLGIGLARFF